MSDFDEFHLRAYVRARDAGRAEEAHHAWQELVSGNFDRLQNFVRAESHAHLSPAEQDEAFSRVLFEMLANVETTFRGTSMGEFVKTARRVVHFRCIDVQQDAVRRREVGYAAYGDDEGPGPGERQTAADSLDRGAIEEDEAEERDLTRYGARFLDWALPQLTGKRREVLELERQGITDKDIGERLNCSRDVVYQSRKRGRDDLARLRDHYEES